MTENSTFETPRVSRLAVASFILGLLAIFALILTVYPLNTLIYQINTFALAELIIRDLIWLSPLTAFITGMIGLYLIIPSPRLLKGIAYAVIGISLSFLPLILSPFIIVDDISTYLKSEVVEIDDVAREKSVILSIAPDRSTGLKLYISGHLDGSAEISILNCSGGQSGDERTFTVLSGKVRIFRDGDWYSDKCEIKYKPNDVRSGSLRVRYYFR